MVYLSKSAKISITNHHGRINSCGYDEHAHNLLTTWITKKKKRKILSLDSMIWNYEIGHLKKVSRKILPNKMGFFINTSLIHTLFLPFSFNLWGGKSK